MRDRSRILDLMPFGTPSNLWPHPIDFDPADRAHLSKLADGRLAFRVLTPAGFTRAALAIRTSGAPAMHEFDLVGRAGTVAFWELALDAGDEPFEYSLAFLADEGVPVYFTAMGITGAVERIDTFMLDPAGLEPHDVPAWAVGAVVYQIFPDRFADGEPSTSPPGVRPWDEPPTSRGFQGGDLIGISQKVDYLVSLGVDLVYLNPVNVSPSNHRYDASDYHHVDPRLGGDEGLRLLVKELHAAGIRIMLDASLNHAHPTWSAFADVVERGQESEYASWFQVDDWPPRVRYRPHLIEEGTWWAEVERFLPDETGLTLEAVEDDGKVFEPTYDTWYGVPTMPRIDLADPGARQHALGIIRHWITEFDIDGWRMDVARYIDHDVWPDVRNAARQARHDVYLLAEIFGDTRRWLQGDEFDATMNYTFRQLVLDWIGSRRIDAERFLEGYLRMLAMYSPAVTAVSHNLIGSHDKPRFLTLAGEDRDRLRLGTFLQMTLPGAPGLYYGDEIGLVGGEDPGMRATFKWDGVDGEPLVEHLRSLGRIRREHDALRRGGFRLVAAQGEAFAFARTGDADVLVAVNGGLSETELEMDVRGETVMTSGMAELTERGVRLGPLSGAVLA